MSKGYYVLVLIICGFNMVQSIIRPQWSCVMSNDSVLDYPLCTSNCTVNFTRTCAQIMDNKLVCADADIISQKHGPGFQCSFHCRACYLSDSNCTVSNSHNHRGGCNCTHDDSSYTWKILYKGVVYQVLSYRAVTFCFMNTTYTSFNGNPHPFGYSLTRKRSSPISQINWNIPQLIIITPLATQGGIFVSWAFNTQSSWFNCNSGQCLNTLDYSMFQLTGSLVIKVFINDTIDNSASFSISPTDTCSTDQPFGGDMFTKWQCHSTWIKVGFILICIVIVLAIIIVTLCIIKCICCCWRPAQPGLVINNNLDNNEPVDTSDLVIALKRLTNNQMMVIMLFGLILGAAGQQCVNGVTLNSVSQVCVDSGVDETCHFQGDVLLSLPYIGSTSCLFFNSPDSGALLGQLEITYTNSLKITSLQQNYYTSDWSGIWASSRSCSHSGGCQCFGDCPTCCCSTYNGTPVDVNMQGQPPTFYPGRSICTSQCGCAGCGCFFCDSSCVYSRAAFVPRGPVLQVMSIFNTIIRPSVNVAFRNGEQSWSQNVDITAGEVQINANLSMAIVGSLQGSNVEFGTNKLIISNNQAFIGAAAVANGPVRGIPGDIQSPTITGLTTPNVNSFIFAPDLYTAQFTTDTTSYSFAQSGASIITNGQYTPLPSVIGSTLYTFSNGQLVGDDAQPGALLVSVFMSQPFVITRKVNLVCPNIVGISIAGCYQCLEGAQFVVTAYSLCNSGPALVSVISEQNITIQVFSVILNITSGNIIVNFQSFNKYIVGTFKLTAGSHTSSIAFQGTLDNPKGITITNETFPPGWVSGPNNPLFDWFSNLSGPWNYVKWVIVAIIIVVATVIVAVAGYFGYKWYKNKYGTGQTNTNYAYEEVDNDHSDL